MRSHSQMHRSLPSALKFLGTHKLLFGRYNWISDGWVVCYFQINANGGREDKYTARRLVFLVITFPDARWIVDIFQNTQKKNFYSIPLSLTALFIPASTDLNACFQSLRGSYWESSSWIGSCFVIRFLSISCFSNKKKINSIGPNRNQRMFHFPYYNRPVFFCLCHHVLLLLSKLSEISVWKCRHMCSRLPITCNKCIKCLVSHLASSPIQLWWRCKEANGQKQEKRRQIHVILSFVHFSVSQKQ